MCNLAPRLCCSLAFIRSVRYLAFAVGFWLVFQTVVMASNTEPHPSPEMADLDLIKWGTTQGGLVLVTLVILWSYRRDFKSLHAEERERLKVVTAIAERSAAGLADSTAAHRESAQAVRELTQALLQRQG